MRIHYTNGAKYTAALRLGSIANSHIFCANLVLNHTKILDIIGQVDLQTNMLEGLRLFGQNLMAMVENKPK